MKRFFMITVFTLFASGMMYAGTAQSVENNTAKQIITQAGTHHSVKGSKQYFTGNVRVDRLFNAEKEAPFTASYVTFEPGARSFWHVHTAGQHLVVTYGIGRTGTADGKVEEFRAGRCALVPTGRQALAWCRPPHRNDAHGHHRGKRRQEHRMDGRSYRGTVQRQIINKG